MTGPRCSNPLMWPANENCCTSLVYTTSSRHRRQRSHSRDSLHYSSKTKRKSSSLDHDEMLRTILDSLTELKSDVLSCNPRISDLESNFAREYVTNCQQDMIAVERDEEMKMNRWTWWHKMKWLLSHQTRLLTPNTTNKSPDSPIERNNLGFSPTEMVSQPRQSNNRSSKVGTPLQASSWSPTDEFNNFLEKNFRRKLTFDQMYDILEQQAVPSVGAVVAPTLNPSILNYTSQLNRKFVQDRNKE